MTLKPITHLLTNEKAVIPISLVGSIIGAAIWINTVALKTDANAKLIEKLETKQQMIENISSDLQIIKYRLDQIDRKLGRERYGKQ